MLISHQKKCLFVHIQKTAGSSVSQLLTQNIPDISSYLGTHDHALWAKNKAEFDWDAYYKFAFVRNPWDRLLSWYMMITQHAKQKSLGLSDHKNNLLWMYVLDNSDSFESFIHNCTGVIDDVDGRKSFIYNQLDYLTDNNGNIIVDYIGQFESLAASSQHISNALKLNNVTIPHVNTSQHSHYRDYYSDDTRQIVAERFAIDINYFSYQF